MKPSFTSSTRAMCASAFLLGESFRRRVLDDPVEKGLAVAPELDIDVRLLAQVCKFARARDAKYDIFLILALLLCLPLWALDRNVGFAGVAVATAAIFLYKTYDERSNLLPRFRKDRAGSAQMSLFTGVQLDSYLSAALASDEQNVIVYSGFNPFVGAGFEVGSWSFSLDVSRPNKDAGPPGLVMKFSSAEISDSVSSALRALSLDGFVTSDFFFVSGTSVKDFKTILPDVYAVPRQVLQPETAEGAPRDTESLRKYRWAYIVDAQQEIVVSIIFRFVVNGPTMFVEFNKFILPQLRDEFSQIERLKQWKTWYVIVFAVASLLMGPLRCLMAIFSTYRRMARALGILFGTSYRKRRTEIDAAALFDYGATDSLRQSLSSDQYKSFFQKADADFYMKSLERTFLSAVLEFLEEHNVDVGDMRDKQSVIVNSGIIVHGGDVKADTLAVGEGAKARKTEVAATNPRKEEAK